MLKGWLVSKGKENEEKQNKIGNAIGIGAIHIQSMR